MSQQDKQEAPEPCECGCGGCEKQQSYDAYILEMLRKERKAPILK
jgi:hypothetical protein